MAFPTTSIVDNFNRGDEAPLATASSGVSWSAGDIGDLGTTLKVATNVCQARFAGVENSQWITTSTYGPNSESYIDISTLPPSGGFVRVYLRVASPGPGSSADGYLVGYVATSADTRVYRMDNVTATQLGAAVGSALSAGDGIGLDIVGSTLTVYNKTGGAWAALDTRSDSAYSAAGFIAVGINNTTTAVDNFGGGSISGAPPAAQVPITVLQGQRW